MNNATVIGPRSRIRAAISSRSTHRDVHEKGPRKNSSAAPSVLGPRSSTFLLLPHRDEVLLPLAPHEQERRLTGLHFLELALRLADAHHLLPVDFEDHVARLDARVVRRPV